MSEFFGTKMGLDEPELLRKWLNFRKSLLRNRPNIERSLGPLINLLLSDVEPQKTEKMISLLINERGYAVLRAWISDRTPVFPPGSPRKLEENTVIWCLPLTKTGMNGREYPCRSLPCHWRLTWAGIYAMRPSAAPARRCPLVEHRVGPCVVLPYPSRPPGSSGKRPETLAFPLKSATGPESIIFR